MEKVLVGVINVLKPLHITSNGVVTKIRKATGIKKVGHTGTLDPDADGVLPICIGKATKVAGMLTDADKAYRAVIRLGIVTDSQDMTGNVIKSTSPCVTKEEFANAVNSFVGEISQIPPMFSAIKQNGQPLYKLARQGIEVERKPRNIRIFKIDILDFDGEKGVIQVYCSKGTYIRTLCADIGEKLGCGACMEALTRIKSGPFEIENAIPLEKLVENPQLICENIISPQSLFDYESVTVNSKYTEKIKNGNPVPYDNGEEKLYKVFSSRGEFLCISKCEKGMLKMVQSFY
ncbi:MAG: tRNA pseudouridine(55) synthase TruB [Clostridia bacterium]|nr:tRNA pseudouridine(55) synthase TruB [Clostridia bacterium]